MDWKARLRNKTFWLALASAIILLLQQLGLDSKVPSNSMEIVNTVLLILTILGVIIDPTTKGITDGQKLPETKPIKPIEQKDK